MTTLLRCRILFYDDVLHSILIIRPLRFPDRDHKQIQKADRLSLRNYLAKINFGGTLTLIFYHTLLKRD